MAVVLVGTIGRDVLEEKHKRRKEVERSVLPQTGLVQGTQLQSQHKLTSFCNFYKVEERMIDLYGIE